MKLSILCLKEPKVDMSINSCISIPENCFILAKNADPDAIFHLEVHCFPKYRFTGIQKKSVRK